MKRRWRLVIAGAGLLVALVAVPVAGIEIGCRAPIVGFDPHAPYRPLVHAGRPEARTWLTYPEWHIVYSAESFGRWLSAGHPPSGYGYGGDIAGFWRGFCAINRVARGQPGAGEAKLMIYTIGISFTVEMAVKAIWDRHGQLGDFALVIKELRDSHGELGVSLARSLAAYDEGGTYGGIFNGQTNLDIENPLTVFEMGALESKPDLRSVIVLALFFIVLAAARLLRCGWRLTRGALRVFGRPLPASRF